MTNNFPAPSNGATFTNDLGVKYQCVLESGVYYWKIVTADNGIIQAATLEPTGFQSPGTASCTMSMSTNIFTLTRIAGAPYYVWYRGVRLTISTDLTVDLSSFNSGDLIFITMTSAGVLAASTSPWLYSDIQIATVYKNTY